MNSIIPLVIGIALGFVIAWLWATSRSATVLQRVQVDAEGRVRAAESTLAEVRTQINALQASFDAKEKEAASLQQALRGASELKVRAQTELEQLQNGWKT